TGAPSSGSCTTSDVEFATGWQAPTTHETDRCSSWPGSMRPAAPTRTRAPTRCCVRSTASAPTARRSAPTRTCITTARQRPAAGRAAPDPLRTARITVRQPALLPAVESDPAALRSPGEPLQPGGKRRLSLRRLDLPSDRAPHGGRDEQDAPVPRRAAAGVLLRGLARAG